MLEAYESLLRMRAVSRETYPAGGPAAGEKLHELVEAEAAFVAAGARGPLTPLEPVSTAGLDITVDLPMAQVPTAVYHLFDRRVQPLLVITIRNRDDVVRRLRVSSYLEGYSARAVDTIELEGHAECEVRQLPTLFHGRVEDVREVTAATLNVLVEDIGGGVELHRTDPVRLLARHYVPLWNRCERTGRWLDVSRYLGAFVTPNAPEVQEFLHLVAECHPLGRLAGYRGPKPGDDTESQLEAVFDALRKRGIRYVNSTVAFNPETRILGQRIRLPRETLEVETANCIDGAVLVASLLEAMSLNPAIVVTPGHAFVGVQRSPGSDEWCYLETTRIAEDVPYETARASADREAAERAELARLRPEEDEPTPGHPADFVRLVLPELRTRHNVMPLE